MRRLKQRATSLFLVASLFLAANLATTLIAANQAEAQAVSGVVQILHTIPNLVFVGADIGHAGGYLSEGWAQGSLTWGIVGTITNPLLTLAGLLIDILIDWGSREEDDYYGGVAVAAVANEVLSVWHIIWGSISLSEGDDYDEGYVERSPMPTLAVTPLNGGASLALSGRW